MKLKLQALAAIAALSASSAFAAGGADFDQSVNFADVTTATIDTGVTQEIADAMADPLAVGTGVYSSNVGLISQLGDDNMAVISQETGTGNFAAISQDSANGPNVGIIAQNGGFNRAIISQK